MPILNERVQREKEQYNQGLDRGRYNDVLSHTEIWYQRRRAELVAAEMAYGENKDILELGSMAWTRLIEPTGIKPARLDCINISESELEKGIIRARDSYLEPHFKIMDANTLEYADDSFDIIFGEGILHHLDFEKALDEVRRCLKPGGKMIFVEPLDNNPVGKIVRMMTPKARTEDERPLRFAEFKELRSRFDCRFYYEGLFSVPFGVISRYLFKSADNWLTRSAFQLDLSLDRSLAFLRPYFRHVLIVGEKAGS